MHRLVKWIAAASAAVMFVGALVAVSFAQEAAPIHPAVGKRVPAFTLTDTAGDEITRDDVGGRYAVLFFTTTDAPSRRAVRKLLEAVGADENFTIVGVVLDVDRSTAGGPTPAIAARNFKFSLGEGGMRSRFKVAVATPAIRQQFGTLIGKNQPIADVPTIVFVDANDLVTAVISGEPSAAELAAATK